MPRLWRAAIAGSLIGVLGFLLSFVPPGLALEENLGLSFLFTMRGQRPPPDDVVVVSIDRSSAAALGVPSDPARWPRTLHARLTDRLAENGAAVIVWDVFFGEPRSDEQDRQFADSARRGGVAVFASYLTRETGPLGGSASGHVSLERLLPPAAVLADAATATASFPLPAVPIRVNQYWTFKTGAGGAPTLPLVAFQLYAIDAYEDLVRLLERERGQSLPVPRDRGALLDSRQVEPAMRRIREAFEADPRLAARMLDALADMGPASERVRALIELYRSPESQYLNFYGPPRTLSTISYHRALESHEPLPVKGKAVFIGMSESVRTEQKDGFHTVFSGDGELDLSGVEIAATAFSNLLEHAPVQPLGAGTHAALVLASGALLGVLSAMLPPLAAAAAILLVLTGYLVAAQHAFATLTLWCPLVVPVLVQAPLAFVAAVYWRYAETNRERRHIREAFAHYLPETAIDELVSQLRGVRTSERVVRGICVSTDAEQYTTLAESMEPAELARFMNRYYAAVFAPIRRNGGFVSDVVGDSALAIWIVNRSDAALGACLAACDIAAAIQEFNRSLGALKLPTRVGLDVGPMALGNVGAVDHYEYRAVGDVVNTATRIQGLNKLLGTRILASEEVVRGIDAVLTRPIGTFLLPGKSKPIAVHEIICRRELASADELGLSVGFGEILRLHDVQAWSEASEKLSALLRHHGEDGPSRFYMRRCETALARPPEVWDPVVRVDQK
jgi:adenylate cyclase